MRQLTIALALIALSFSPSAVLAAEDGDGTDEQSEQVEKEVDAEAEVEDGEEVEARALAPVEPYRWEFEGGAGIHQWRTVYGDYESERIYRLASRFVVTDPISVAVSGDFSRQVEDTTPLTFSNRRAAMAAGVGLHRPMSFWLLSADLEVGGYYEQRSLTDVTGNTSDWRLRPMGGLTARAGMVLYSTAVIGFRAGARLYPHGVEPIYTVSLSWLR